MLPKDDYIHVRTTVTLWYYTSCYKVFKLLNYNAEVQYRIQKKDLWLVESMAYQGLRVIWWQFFTLFRGARIMLPKDDYIHVRTTVTLWYYTSCYKVFKLLNYNAEVQYRIQKKDLWLVESMAYQHLRVIWWQFFTLFRGARILLP